MSLFPVFAIPTSIAQFFGLTWWLWFFAIFFPIFHSTWLFWRQCLFKEDLQWVTLELRIPREIKKSSKAMQQVSNLIHLVPQNGSREGAKARRRKSSPSSLGGLEEGAQAPAGPSAGWWRGTGGWPKPRANAIHNAFPERNFVQDMP